MHLTPPSGAPGAIVCALPFVSIRNLPVGHFLISFPFFTCGDALANDEETTPALMELSADGARRNTLGRAARAFVERHHEWETMPGQSVALVQEVGCDGHRS